MTTEMPKLIKGKRITLKAPDVSFKFAEMMYAVVDANREHVLPWLDWALPENTKTAEDDYLFALEADKDRNAGSRFEFAIYDNADQSYLGGIALMKRGKDSNQCFEIGYWLKKEACGKGYMQEAVNLTAAAAFDYGAERLIIKADTENLRSQSVAVRCGFQFESIERHGNFNEALQKFTDIKVFSKLKDE